MRRFGRMQPLGHYLDRMTNRGSPRRLREIWLASQAARLFGERVAAHVVDLRLIGTRVLIRVDDPLWLGEMERNKDLVLQRVRALFPAARTVEIESSR